MSEASRDNPGPAAGRLKGFYIFDGGKVGSEFE